MGDVFETLRRQIEHAKSKDEGKEIEQCLCNAFSTGEGKKALEILCELWLDIQLFVPGDPHGTAYNLGHADLVNFIKDCVKTGGE